jgi:hypothetical protein
MFYLKYLQSILLSVVKLGQILAATKKVLVGAIELAAARGQMASRAVGRRAGGIFLNVRVSGQSNLAARLGLRLFSSLI